MKNIKLLVASVFMGSFLLTGCGSNFVESQIELETENEFVVEFNDENVDISSAVASVESVSDASYKARPYEGFFIFTVEDGSYEQLETICSNLEQLPEVKGARTKWDK
nr:hypothetical protein [uncultured Butyrivibrio sp.]